MHDVVDLTPPQPARPDPREALQALALSLTELLDAPLEPALLDEAVDAALRRHGEPGPESWPHVVDDLALSLGLRVSWRVSGPDDLREEVHPGLPAVTWSPRGWELIDRRGAQLRLRRHPGRDLPRPFALTEIDPRARTWAMIEHALPAEVFGGAGGRPPLRRLLRLARAERDDLNLVLIYAVATGILGLATPVAVQVLVNTVAFGAFRQPILYVSLMLLICLGLAALLRGMQRIVVEMLQRRIFVRVVADLAERLPRVQLTAWDRTHGPELVNRFFDVLTIQKSLSSLLLDGLSASLQALVGMILLAVYHPALLGFDILLLLAIVGLVWGFGRRGQDTAIVESKYKYAVVGWLEEIAAHPTLYKLGGGAELAVRRADVLARRWLDARESHFKVFFQQYGGALALQAIANTALLAEGAWLVLDRQLTIGQLVAAEFVVATVLLGFAKFSEKLESFYDLLAATDKLGQLVDLPLERSHGWRVELPTAPVGLDVDGVAWKWSDTGRGVTDVTFQARPGESLAIVGDDGAGKSTLADMLLGMRDPVSGQVRMDGVDLREMRLDTLRRRVALVRSGEVVSGSIADNIALGRPTVTTDALLDALERVGLGERITSLPKGVDTVLTPGGAPLTEGERARLAVARALAPTPRLVVVDGLLDTLGPTDRDALLRALTPPDAPWTLVVLTRDTSLARRLGRALRLADGQVRPLPSST